MASKAASKSGSNRGLTYSTANPSVNTRASADLPPQANRLLLEATAIISIGAIVFLAIILLTYQPTDPGWSHAVKPGAVQNAGGPFGAWVADVLLFLFGLSAYWFVVWFALLLIGSVQRWRNPNQPRASMLWLHIPFVMLLISSSAIETLREHSLRIKLPYAPGGMVGDAVSYWLAMHLGFTGATLFLLLTIVVSVSLFFGFSWMGVCEKIGAATEAVFWSALTGMQAWRDRRIGETAAQVREVRIEAQKEIIQTQPIHIEKAVAEIKPSKRAVKERQATLFEDLPDSPLPPLALLDEPDQQGPTIQPETLEYTSRLIEKRLLDFGVEVKVVAAYPGPVITRYEIEPAVGVKGSQIVGLMRDLARALSVTSIRVVETIPGKSVMGLEIPNSERQMVRLSEILSSEVYAKAPSFITLSLGKDIGGHPMVADLERMPHLLVAGTTGSGKSVGINAMILSMLYKATANEVRMILIDPKMLELSVYDNIPHLLAPVVTDMKLAVNALNWCVAEMERRYKLMSSLGVRNLNIFNQKIRDAEKNKKPILDPLKIALAQLNPEAEIPHLTTLPLIVVVIDELADLMMTTGKKIEELIARLAQKARAAGIHLILATQRPSVDVITGLIKANIPSRIAFQVSAKVDSRTILDQMGAEALLGQGDMLYLPPGTGYPQRVHGAFVSDAEVHRVVDYLKSRGEPAYIDDVLAEQETNNDLNLSLGGGGNTGDDALYDQAVEIVIKTGRVSISLVQRHLRIGYNRAARIVEEMEKQGLVSAMQSNGNRMLLGPKS